MDKAQCKRAIKEAKSAKNWDALLVACQAAIKAFPEAKVFQEDLEFAQAHYINEKLHSDVVHQLEEKKDYVTLQTVYKKLLLVFPSSKKLHKLLDKVALKLQKAHREEYKAYFDNAKHTIHDFMKDGKFEDAEQACYEILSQDPENHSFNKLLDKVNKALDRDIQKGLKAYFKEAIPKLKEEYKANKKAFIWI